MLLSCRPPTFKQSTPSCRTNMRQLLWREQCLERDRRTGQDTSSITSSTSGSGSASSAACKIPTALQDQPRIQDIPTEVYKVSVSLQLCNSAKQKRNVFQCMFICHRKGIVMKHLTFSNSKINISRLQWEK